MNKRKRFGVSQSLNKGLSETIQLVENNRGLLRNVLIPIDQMELDPENPRKLAITLDELRNQNPNFNHEPQKKAEYEALHSLAATIKKDGLLNPVVAYVLPQGGYQIIAGERRYLASLLAGFKEIEARIYDKRPSGLDLKILQWVENTEREDLSLIERLQNIVSIRLEYMNAYGTAEFNTANLCQLTGLSERQAINYLAILKGPEKLNQAIASGIVKSIDKAALLAVISSPTILIVALEACSQGCSLKELRNIINTQNKITANNKKIIKEQLVKGSVGRKKEYVQLGKTQHPTIIKEIITAVLSQPQYRNHAELFAHIDWQHPESVSTGFKQLLNLLGENMIAKHKMPAEHAV
jgi:ParB family chromosome partitioning protein